MKQRILIAMAISCKPSLIIADEPTSALDVTVQMQILGLLGGIRDSLRTSILLITHDLGIVAGICDRVFIMYAGKIVEDGPVEKLYVQPLHPYTQGLLRSTLSIDEFREQIETIDGVVPDLSAPPAGCRFHPRCPYVKEVCRRDAPPLLLQNKCRVACWLYG